MAIDATLRDERRPVEIVIDGLAASAATIITCAGSTVKIRADALMMIHSPWSVTIGNASKHRETVPALDAVTESIIATYVDVSTTRTDDAPCARGGARSPYCLRQRCQPPPRSWHRAGKGARHPCCGWEQRVGGSPNSSSRRVCSCHCAPGRFGVLGPLWPAPGGAALTT